MTLAPTKAAGVDRATRNAQRGTIAMAVALVGLALALRLTLLVRSNWLLEGDDALSTLMALGILDGDRPIMLKNQTYAAAWEPYAMAATYATVGISRVSAKLPALLGSLGLIGTTWLLAREVAGRAAAWFAALLIAFSPAYVLVLSLKPWAPYTEVILFGSLCLTCAVRLAWPKPQQDDRRWALACGVAAGLALWMHPLAVWYLAAAALTLLFRVRARRWPGVIAGGLVGFGLGGVPIWLYNLQRGGATFRFVLGGTQAQTADRLAVLNAWWNNDLPRGAGLWHPWGPSPVLAGAVMAALVVGALAWAVLIGRCRKQLLRPLDTLLLFLVLVPLVLVLSGFGGPALNPYGFDATGRYAPPIWTALGVVGGAALAAVWRLGTRPKTPESASQPLAAFPGAICRKKLGRLRLGLKTGLSAELLGRWMAILLAAVPMLLNLVGAISIDPLAAFQSPYWDKLPADNTPLLDTLEGEGVSSVWMNHWAGQPAMFDARSRGQTLFAYDWYDVQAGGIDRFPEYLPLVEQAERPAFVLVTNEAEPELERTLRLMGVSFVERRAAPYVVVIPTSRKVQPGEVTPALDYRY